MSSHQLLTNLCRSNISLRVMDRTLSLEDFIVAEIMSECFNAYVRLGS